MEEDKWFKRVQELHEWLWKFVHTINGPSCSGNLDEYLPNTLSIAKRWRIERLESEIKLIDPEYYKSVFES